jgi:hypothetical protein
MKYLLITLAALVAACEVAPGEVSLDIDSALLVVPEYPDKLQCPDVYLDGNMLTDSSLDTDTGDPEIRLECTERLDCINALPILTTCVDTNYVQTNWECIDNECVEELTVRFCDSCTGEGNDLVLIGCTY